jgi:membrane associated rhomboid family serine protease
MHQASVGFQCPDCAKAGRSREVSGGALLRRHDTPIVTNALIAINVAVFVYSLFAGADLVGNISKLHADFAILGAAQVPGPTDAMVPVSGTGVAGGEWYRLLTGGFLHYGVFHVAMNMYALYVLGPQLERALGKLEFLGVYFVALLAGSFGALMLSPFDYTAGASGAIYGLLGAAVVLQRRLGIDPWQSGLGGLILINLGLTIAIGLSLGGHVGGFVGGAMAAWIVLEAGVQKRPVVGFLGCLALAAAFVFGGIWAANQAFVTGHAVLSF